MEPPGPASVCPGVDAALGAFHVLSKVSKEKTLRKCDKQFVFQA